MAVSLNEMRLIFFILMFCWWGCTPFATYEQLSEEAEITGDNTKVEKFEAIAEKAEAHYHNRDVCIGSGTSSNLMWTCSSIVKEQIPKPNWDLDQKVRAYKKDHLNCGCVNRDQQIRALKGY